MKPSALGNEQRRHFPPLAPPFPVLDSNYQTPFPLDHFYGGPSENPHASFLTISRKYFRYEARRNFLAEAAFFLVFAAALALTFVSGAIAIIQFLTRPEA